MTATAKEIQEFLDAFKSDMDQNGLNIWPTQKNDAFLLESGFSNDDVETIIRSLAVRDYEAGPKDDDKGHFRADGEVWIFSREYEGFELYIKLKRTGTQTIVSECLSAHEAEFPMRKPMRRHK